MTGPKTAAERSPSPSPATLVKLVIGSIGGVMLLSMMALTVTDVIGRYVMNSPVLGATELTELLLAATIFLGLPLVSMAQDHVTVDLVTDKLPGWTKTPQLILTGLFAAVVLAIVAWRIWVYADQIAGYGGSTNSLRIPVAPLGWFCAICAGAGAVLSALAPFATLLTPKD